MDGTAGESAATCPVHRVPLRDRSVRVAYGLPAPPPEGYEEAEERLFPFAGTPPLGGCCVPEPPETAVVRVCARCEEARRAWWRESAGR